MNRREICTEEWRKKFNEFELSEKFEFIERVWESDRGRKCYVKCKACGECFDTYGVYEVFRGRQDHLLCINCGASSDGNDVFARSPKCDEMLAFYSAGHTVQETMEKFGLTRSFVNNAVKKNHATNGRNFKDNKEVNDKRKKEAEQKLTSAFLIKDLSILAVILIVKVKQLLGVVSAEQNQQKMLSSGKNKTLYVKDAKR